MNVLIALALPALIAGTTFDPDGRTQSDLNAAINSLLHANAFASFRTSGRCGPIDSPMYSNHGCDLSSIKTCCTPAGTCEVAVWTESQCIGEGFHDHADHAKCRGGEGYERPQHYDPAVEFPCAHRDVRADQTYKDPTHDASTYFDAPINEGKKQTVELQSLLAAYKQRKIASALEVGRGAQAVSSTKEGAAAIAKLTSLGEEVEEAASRLAEQKKSMGIETSHADFVDFVKQSPAHLNALHAALGAEDEDVNVLMRNFMWMGTAANTDTLAGVRKTERPRFMLLAGENKKYFDHNIEGLNRSFEMAIDAGCTAAWDTVYDEFGVPRAPRVAISMTMNTLGYDPTWWASQEVPPEPYDYRIQWNLEVLSNKKVFTATALSKLSSRSLLDSVWDFTEMQANVLTKCTHRPVFFLPLWLAVGDRFLKMAMQPVPPVTPSSEPAPPFTIAKFVTSHRAQVGWGPGSLILFYGARNDGRASMCDAVATELTSMLNTGQTVNAHDICTFSLWGERKERALARADVIWYDEYFFDAPVSVHRLNELMARGKTVVHVTTGSPWAEAVYQEAGVVFVPSDANKIAVELLRYAKDSAARHVIAQKERAWLLKKSSEIAPLCEALKRVPVTPNAKTYPSHAKACLPEELSRMFIGEVDGSLDGGKLKTKLKTEGETATVEEAPFRR